MMTVGINVQSFRVVFKLSGDRPVGSVIFDGLRATAECIRKRRQRISFELRERWHLIRLGFYDTASLRSQK